MFYLYSYSIFGFVPELSEKFSTPEATSFLGLAGFSIQLVFWFFPIPDSISFLGFVRFNISLGFSGFLGLFRSGLLRHYGAIVPNFAYLYMATHNSLKSEKPPICNQQLPAPFCW